MTAATATTTRRRFVAIVAAGAATLPLAEAVRAAAAGVRPVVWRGTALGAMASLTLVHPDRALARGAVERCVAEVARLEAVFSLYRRDSALVRLNAAGTLRAPPHELLELLAFALDLARRSGGVFDPTVQPLYRLYADHYAQPHAQARGPSPEAIARVLRVVDHAAVELGAGRIRLGRPGMAITLNGVAQGYVTDRVADLLRDAGFDDVLVDLGEARAHGHGPAGGAWRAALADPRDATRTLLELPLGAGEGVHAALATSAGAGTVFGPDPRIHHLLDARSGRSANHWLQVSVSAPRATSADGLSTALALLPRERAFALLSGAATARAWFADAQGRVEVRPGA